MWQVSSYKNIQKMLWINGPNNQIMKCTAFVRISPSPFQFCISICTFYDMLENFVRVEHLKEVHCIIRCIQHPFWTSPFIKFDDSLVIFLPFPSCQSRVLRKYPPVQSRRSQILHHCSQPIDETVFQDHFGHVWGCQQCLIVQNHQRFHLPIILIPQSLAIFFSKSKIPCNLIVLTPSMCEKFRKRK